MKYSVIKPLYKKGNKRDVSNYRPISLLTSFSKILEKVIQIRLLDHLHKINIISKERYGFRRGFTTENAVYKLINEVLNALNNKQIVGGIFCGLTKAFDCVDHDILIPKIEKYGIIGKGKELFQSYVKDRYQRVL